MKMLLGQNMLMHRNLLYRNLWRLFWKLMRMLSAWLGHRLRRTVKVVSSDMLLYASSATLKGAFKKAYVAHKNMSRFVHFIYELFNVSGSLRRDWAKLIIFCRSNDVTQRLCKAFGIFAFCTDFEEEQPASELPSRVPPCDHFLPSKPSLPLLSCILWTSVGLCQMQAKREHDTPIEPLHIAIGLFSKVVDLWYLSWTMG